jgi:hypothetical protein
MSVKINEKQWNALSDEEKASVIRELIEGNVITGADDIETSSEVEAFDEGKAKEFGASLQIDGAQLMGWNPGKDLCRAKCQIAAAAGAAACANLSGPAFAACMLVVNEGYRKCYNDC